jgi:transposase
MHKAYIVRLTSEERGLLHQRVASGTVPAHVSRHARILLKVDQGPAGPGWCDVRVAEALETSERTVSRVRRRYADEGLTAAVERRRPGRSAPRKLDGRQEARLIALACGPAPDGYARWSLRLLADRFVTLDDGDAISYETVRRTLKKTISSRG